MAILSSVLKRGWGAQESKKNDDRVACQQYNFFSLNTSTTVLTVMRQEVLMQICPLNKPSDLSVLLPCVSQAVIQQMISDSESLDLFVVYCTGYFCTVSEKMTSSP